MKVLIAIVLVLAFMIGSVQLIGSNMQDVTIHITGNLEVTTTVMKLVITCVLLGVFVGLLVHLYYNLGQRVSEGRRKRQEKKDKEVGTLYLEGRSRLLSLDLKKARTSLQKAYDRDPKRMEVAMALAEVELAEGNGDKARELWKKVHKDNPQEIESLLRHAQVNREQGLVKEAIAMYQDVLKIDKDNLKSLKSLRDLFISSARWADAIELQKRLLKMAPDAEADKEKRLQVCLRYEQALEQLENDQADKAIGELKDLVKQASEFVPAYVSLGDALRQTGKLSDAAKRWQQGYETFEQGVFLSRLEEGYLGEDDPAPLLTVYRTLMGNRPDDIMLRLYFSRLALRLELVDEAIDNLQMVEATGARFALLHNLLAEAYRRRDQTAEAIEEYRKALGADDETGIGYQCHECGAEFASWLGRCDACGDWGGFRLSGREVLQGPSVLEGREIHHGERRAAE